MQWIGWTEIENLDISLLVYTPGTFLQVPRKIEIFCKELTQIFGMLFYKEKFVNIDSGNAHKMLLGLLLLAS